MPKIFTDGKLADGWMIVQAILPG